MDKLTLNTEIVSMRHATRRARVHVINKLVREARKLKNKKGSDEQRKKYQRKASRLTEEVFIIKKLKDDDISKSALLNTQCAEEVISDAAVTLETRALARLANHHHLKIRINEFRKKYPTWTESLPQLLPQLGAKRKKKGREKIKRKGETAESTVIKSNDANDITGNNDKENNSKLEKSTEDAKCELNRMKKKRERKTSVEDSMLNQNAEKKIEDKLQKQSGIGEVKRFAELLKEENSMNDDDDDDDGDDGKGSDVPVTSEPSKADPFFLYDDENDDSQDEEHMQNDQERKMKKHSEERWGKLKHMGPNRRQRRQQLFGSKPTHFGFKSFQHKPTKVFSSRVNEQMPPIGRKKEDHSPLQGNNMTVHPSWEAKRKLKEQQHAISAFQGKKIKFADE